MTGTTGLTEDLPRWNVADVHESMRRARSSPRWNSIGADADRLGRRSSEHDVRAIEPRPVTAADGLVPTR